MSEKKNNTAVSDEKIVEAVLKSGSIWRAAEIVGTSPRAVFGRILGMDFSAVCDSLKSDATRQFSFSICRNIAAAITVVIEIMNNEENPAETRLSAAKLFLDKAGMYLDGLTAAEKTTAEMAELVGLMFYLDANKL